MSTKEDADRFLYMIESCFVSKPVIRMLPNTWDNMRKKYEKLFLGKSKIKIETTVNENLSKIDIDRHIFRESTHYYKKGSIGKLQQILLYPIKSCGAFSAKITWAVTPKGLKYDREWMIIGPTGVCLTQKHNKNMCLIKPEIDLKLEILRLKFKGKKTHMYFKKMYNHFMGTTSN